MANADKGQLYLMSSSFHFLTCTSSFLNKDPKIMNNNLMSFPLLLPSPTQRSQQSRWYVSSSPPLPVRHQKSICPSLQVLTLLSFTRSTLHVYWTFRTPTMKAMDTLFSSDHILHRPVTHEWVATLGPFYSVTSC